MKIHCKQSKTTVIQMALKHIEIAAGFHKCLTVGVDSMGTILILYGEQEPTIAIGCTLWSANKLLVQKTQKRPLNERISYINEVLLDDQEDYEVEYSRRG